MTDSALKDKCERSFLKVLYHLKRPGQSIVIDETTDRLYLQKCLEHYDRKVYDYLKAHHCPEIPAIRLVWEEEEKLFLVEEMIAGDSLETCLEKGSLTDTEKRVILEDVCRALIFLHRAAPPLIHRDIKPANIMVTREKRGVLIDFDASKVYKEGKKEDTTLCGTAGTAAPEQYGFGQSDARTDIFAVGRLIGLMFPDDPDWKKVSEKASSFSPGDRYGSVSEMMEHFPSSGEEAEEKPARIPFLCRVPGFRTGKTENMAAALALYGIFLFCSLTLTVENASGPAEIWLNRIFTLLIGISWTALFTDLGFPFSRMPLLRSKNPLVRLISYLLAAALLFAAWITVLVLVSAALF